MGGASQQSEDAGQSLHCIRHNTPRAPAALSPSPPPCSPQATIAKLTAEKGALEGEVADARAARLQLEKDHAHLSAEAVKLQGMVSLLQMEKQGFESGREALQWQIKTQEETLQVREWGR